MVGSVCLAICVIIWWRVSIRVILRWRVSIWVILWWWNGTIGVRSIRVTILRRRDCCAVWVSIVSAIWVRIWWWYRVSGLAIRIWIIGVAWWWCNHSWLRWWWWIRSCDSLVNNGRLLLLLNYSHGILC